MKILIFCVTALLWTVHSAIGDEASDRRDLDFMDLVKYDKYKAEQHYVTTEDGYILGVFRLPIQGDCTESKGPLLFMHGLYLSGDDCIIPGPGKAHCYIYADNCYDVWVPNNRGNYYSRNHTTLDPNKDSDFWDFAFEDMGLYDLPAVIDYILNETDSTQLTYVAHSQGVATLLVLCSKVPSYNDKIKIGFGLSTTAWLDNSEFIVIKLQGVLDPLLSLTGGVLSNEVLTRGGFAQSSLELLCGLTNTTYPICSTFLFAVLGYNEFQITDDVFQVVAGHTPSGTSLKDFNRWGQVRNNGFSEYDYGSIKNLLVYGSLSPPLYDVSAVTMPWIMIGSNNDYVANVTDIKYLVSKLPNASLCVLSDDTFGHLDFIYGKDIPNYITPTVLSQLEKGSYECA